MINLTKFWEKYYIQSSIITFILFFFYLFWIQASFLQTSILNYKLIKSDVFDGTVYPIEFVPNPITLSYDERKKTYSQIDSKHFIKTPIYSPSIFQRNLDDYKIGSKEYLEIITQRLIFPIPYLWTYNFDFKEFSWSHPWVDIIAPEWTPIKNIASWVVVDVGNQASWFWKYVLIKHNQVPLPNWNIWDIYSLYAHMSEIIVKKWIKIKKWELIWYVGQTWNATTPHLHFQIDVSSAPYSPYWPFSSSDMKVAWVWFFDWVNIWLWKENAITYTINPLWFVNKNISSLYLASAEEEIKKEEIKEEENEISEVKENIKNETLEEIIVETLKNTQVSEVKKEGILKPEVELLSTLDINDILSKNEIQIAMSQNKNQILALAENDIIDLKKSFEKIEENSSILDWSGFNITQLSEEKNNTKNNEDRLVESWNILKNKIFLDIDDNYKYIEEVRYFKENNIVLGFSDNTFRPKNNITRVEALKVILLANKVEVMRFDKSLFTDVFVWTWENNYVNAWVETWVIDKNNKKFYPFRNVSRVEVLKIILTLWKVDFENLENDLTFIDVSKNDWFYKYVNYAYKNNLFEITWNKFEPNKPLTREEMISILYKYIKK